MIVETILFYTFAAILLFAAMRVITARNTVHAVLYLVLGFAQASCLWMLLRAEFLSITLILVYVGAVMVLFLFVVMMLDIKLEAHTKGFWPRFGLATGFGFLIALEMIVVFMTVKAPAPLTLDAQALGAAATQVPNTAALGQLLYSTYVLPVQIAATILLVAIIAAITLTLRTRKDSIYVDPAQQVRVKASERLQVLKMSAVHMAPPAAPPLDPAADATGVQS